MTTMTRLRGTRLPSRVLLASALAAALWTSLAGCGDAEGPDPAPDAEVTAPHADAGVRLVDVDRADLVLWVSNQSFDDAEVHLTVAVDGVTVVDGDFHVEGQHNWVQFPLSMEPGTHEITAEADSGATLRESFAVPGDKARYGLIDYWDEDDDAHLEWSFQRRPMAFA